MTSPDTEFISILGAAGSPEAPPRVSSSSLPEVLPILGLSDIVIFPGMVAPLLVETAQSTKLIDDVVENISSRPSIRRNFAVTITCDTPPPKVEQAINIIGGMLREPFMAETFNAESPPRVYFTGFNADSLNIQVTYWYQLSTPGRDPWTYQAQCQEFNLKLLRAFADAGIELAFPTQTVFLAGDAHRQLSVHLAHNGEEPLAHDIRAGAAR